jgi:hypothetical protein
MRPFCDWAFLLRLIVWDVQTPVAWRTIRVFHAPWFITAYHQLQIENALRGRQNAPGVNPLVTQHARVRWEYYLDEGIIEIHDADWRAALRLACQWNQNAAGTPPVLSFLLHPAFAVTGGFSHFLSFEQASRAFAAEAGLTVLPASL